jgi:hypothetical protein
VHGEVTPDNIVIGFSAGVLLWEAMMGRPLFRGAPVDDIVTQLVGGKVPRPEAAGEDADWSADLADVTMRALSVDPKDRWAHVGIMGADIETIAEGRMAKSIDLIVLVTGREVSRDSLSDEVTRPLASIASLTPFANSIPVLDEPTSPDSPEALGGRHSDTTQTVAMRTPASSRVPMAERRRWQIVAGALSFSILLLAIAAMKTLGSTPEASVSTVLSMPASQPSLVESPSVAQPEEPVAEPSPAPAPPPKPAPPAPAAKVAPKPAPAPAPPNLDVRGPRIPTKTTTSGKSKPKEDPFGLSRPVRTKPKDDPFGL